MLDILLIYNQEYISTYQELVKQQKIEVLLSSYGMVLLDKNHLLSRSKRISNQVLDLPLETKDYYKENRLLPGGGFLVLARGEPGNLM